MINTLRIDYDTMRRWQTFLSVYGEDEVEVVSKLINEYIDKRHRQEYNEYLKNPQQYVRCVDCDDE